MAEKSKVGLFGSTMVGVGAMVGAGIFVLCGVALRVAGPGAMLAFALNGVITLITAFSFAELAATFPEAGGGYVFAKKVFPIGAAFAAGWVLWFAYVVAAALYALGFAGFVAYTVQIAFDMHLPNSAKVAIAAFTAVVSIGMILRKGAGAGGWISVGKMIAFLVLIVTGIVVLFGRPAGSVAESFDPLLPFGMVGVLTAMGFTFIALEGYEIIAAVSDEIDRPARTIPRAMFLSIGITMVIYMGLLFVVLTVGGSWEELGKHGETAVAVAAERYAGTFGAVVVIIAALLSTFSALVATLLAASRVSFAMARDRVLPRRFSATRPALFVSGGLVVLVVLATADTEVAGAAASLVFLLSFALANAAGLLVRTRVGAGGGFRAPLYPLLPLLGVMSCLGLALFQLAHVPIASAVVGIWLVVGGVLYAKRLRRGAITVAARDETFDADLVRLRGRTPLVLVPIASPHRAEPLMHLAQALAAPGIGRIVTLTVATFDPESSEESGYKSYVRFEETLRRAIRAAAREKRPFEGVVRLSENATEAIIGTASERRPETILLGMSDMTSESGPRLLESVIARTRADVVVLNSPPDWSWDSVKHIIAPIGGITPHNPVRARILGMLLRDGDRTASLLRVLRRGEDRVAAERSLSEEAVDLGLPASSVIVEESDDAVATIVKHSKRADLLILGLGAAGRERLMGKFALAVVQGAHCPVITIAQARH